MEHDHAIPGETEIFGQEIGGFQMTNSPYFPGFRLKDLMAEVTSCRLIKESIRRKIFYLQTPSEGYFLKLSTLIRRKDRRRHFLLPSRKWAEWRNLHRLQDLGIPTAKPIMKGESKNSIPPMYFLLTSEVGGRPLTINSAAEAADMGDYLAMLHSKGILHTDLHSHNIILSPDGQACLIDVQEMFLLPWLPRWLRVRNLGRLHFNLGCFTDSPDRGDAFLSAYNRNIHDPIDLDELKNAADRHQQRKYRSRSKRCCRTSTEFAVIKQGRLRGFKRREFSWGAKQLQQALEGGTYLKGETVAAYRGVCIKTHRRRFFHQDRCKVSWKMSRALEVRGIAVPRALGYFITKDHTHFLSEFMRDGVHLNDYLSSITDPSEKRQALAKLALWLRMIHDSDIWQRDFKSNNVLCLNHNYYLIDLDGIRIQRLTHRNRTINLAQINASLSNAITIRDRLRFYEYYAADARISRRTRRIHYQEIWNITKTKGTSHYGLDLEKMAPCAVDRQNK
jgi:tRNA A-37 threonylcarbamoyl transferase component Bud32